MEARMPRLFPSFALLLIALAAGPAMANGVHYRAEPLIPPGAGRLVVRGLVWNCGPAGCVTGKSHSRPAIDCSALVREVGAVRRFTVAGRALAAEELEKCNVRAR
jgi:hypothetical protein